MRVILALAIGLIAAGSALAGSDSPEEALASLSRELQARTQECDASFQAFKIAVEENSASAPLDELAGATAKSCGAAYDDMEVLARPHEASYATLKAIADWWSWAHQQVFYRATAARGVQSAIKEHVAVVSEAYKSNVQQQATYGNLAAEDLEKVRESLKKGIGKTPRLNPAAAKKLEAFLTSAVKKVSECNEAFAGVQQAMNLAKASGEPLPSLRTYGERVTTTCVTSSFQFGKIPVPHLGDAIEEALEDWTDAVGSQALYQSNAGIAASLYSTRPDGDHWKAYRQSIAVSVGYGVKASDAMSEAKRLVGITAK